MPENSGESTGIKEMPKSPGSSPKERAQIIGNRALEIAAEKLGKEPDQQDKQTKELLHRMGVSEKKNWFIRGLPQSNPGEEALWNIRGGEKGQKIKVAYTQEDGGTLAVQESQYSWAVEIVQAEEQIDKLYQQIQNSPTAKELYDLSNKIKTMPIQTQEQLDARNAELEVYWQKMRTPDVQEENLDNTQQRVKPHYSEDAQLVLNLHEQQRRLTRAHFRVDGLADEVKRKSPLPSKEATNELPIISDSERLIPPEGYHIDVEAAVQRCSAQEYPGYPQNAERLQWSQEKIDAWEKAGMPLDWMMPYSDDTAPIYINNDQNRWNEGAQKAREAHILDKYDFTKKSFIDGDGNALSTQAALHPQWKNMLLQGNAIAGMGFNWTVNRGKKLASARDGAIIFDDGGVLKALMVVRKDTRQHAFIGGFGADMAALLNEFHEEAHFDPSQLPKVENVYDGSAGDPRDTLFSSRRTNLTVYFPTDSQKEQIMEGIRRQQIYGGDDAAKVDVVTLSEKNIDEMFAMHPELARLAVQEWQKQTGKVLAKDGRIGRAEENSLYMPPTQEILTARQALAEATAKAMKAPNFNERSNILIATVAHESAQLAAHSKAVAPDTHVDETKLQEAFTKALYKATQAFKVFEDSSHSVRTSDGKLTEEYKSALKAARPAGGYTLLEAVHAMGLQDITEDEVSNLLNRVRDNFYDAPQLLAAQLGQELPEDWKKTPDAIKDILRNTLPLNEMNESEQEAYLKGIDELPLDPKYPELTAKEIQILDLYVRLEQATWLVGQPQRAKYESDLSRINPDARDIYMVYDDMIQNNMNLHVSSSDINDVYRSLLATALVEVWKDIKHSSIVRQT